MKPGLLSRRELICAAVVGLGASRAAAAPSGIARAAPMINPTLVNRALAALFRHHRTIWTRDVIAIADFGLPSSVPRFFLVDVLRAATLSLRVTHGRGSDPAHSGMLQVFSDRIDSGATSEGAYLTGKLYSGIHGPSRRLRGLDPTNAHALERAIVIHSASYANPDTLAREGKLGRSDGCFVFAERDIGTVLSHLGSGRLLYAGRAALR